MDKDFEKLLDRLNDTLNEIGSEFEKLTKDATGKTLKEIMDMPVETTEEKRAFVDELMKIKNKLDGEKKCNFKGQYIKITGGESCTSFEACGNNVDLLHMLAQGVATILEKASIKKEDIDEFLKLFSDEIKNMIDKMEII